jgi:hypothetical protein
MNSRGMLSQDLRCLFASGVTSDRCASVGMRNHYVPQGEGSRRMLSCAVAFRKARNQRRMVKRRGLRSFACASWVHWVQDVQRETGFDR